MKRPELREAYRHITVAEWITFCVVVLASVASIYYSINKGSAFHTVLFLLVVVLMFLPRLLEWLFRVRLSALLKVFIMCCIGIGPILGDVFGFYVRFTHWDTLQHIICGFLMALVGYMLPDILNPDLSSRISAPTRLLFALTFGLAAAAVWELYEYVGDTLWGTDMQASTVIHVLHSKHLGSSPDLVETIDDIFDVVINGSELGLGGYIEIGLIDTMEDIFSNAAGILLYCILSLFAVRRKTGWLARTILPAFSWEQALQPGENAGTKDE